MNTHAKTFAILGQLWGEYRDSYTLAGASFRRQQGLTESMGKYASNFRLLLAKTHSVKPNTLTDVMLWDTFSCDLRPVSLKRDMKRCIKENAESTYADRKKEALSWMREDSCPDTTTELLVVPNHDGLKRLETHIAALSTETASLKQQFRQQSDSKATPDQCHIHGSSSDSTPTHNGGPRNLDCSWCQRRGLTESHCRAKQRFQQGFCTPQRRHPQERPKRNFIASISQATRGQEHRRTNRPVSDDLDHHE